MKTDSIFILVFWTGLILFIIGFFKPHVSLFWLKGDRTKKKSAIVYGLFTLATFIGLLFIVDLKPTEATKTEVAQTAQTKTENENSEPNKTAPIINTDIQNEFIKAKTDLFIKYIINPTNSAQQNLFKDKTSSLTQKYLKDNGNILKNWKGTVISVLLLNENGEPTGDTKKDKIIALIVDGGELKIEGSSDNYSIGISQAPSPKRKLKGIYPNNPLYEKILNLKEGSKIIFTAKVLKSEEIGLYDDNAKQHRGYLNQQTSFDVNFLEINVAN
jgi:hypothetical protein